MHKIIGPCLCGEGSTTERRQIVEHCNANPALGQTQADDLQMQAKDVVRALLHRGKGFGPIGHLESQTLVKGQTRIEITYHQSAVIDTLEEFVGGHWRLPWEFRQFQRVAVRVVKVEKSPTIRKALRRWRDELDAMSAQARSGPLKGDGRRR
jgi:hypothetical protein